MLITGYRKFAVCKISIAVHARVANPKGFKSLLDPLIVPLMQCAVTVCSGSTEPLYRGQLYYKLCGGVGQPRSKGLTVTIL